MSEKKSSTPNLKKKAQGLIDELRQKYPDNKGIFVFGSVARGTASENSDIDICIIASNTERRVLSLGNTKVEIYLTPLKKIKKGLKRKRLKTVRRMRNAWIVFDPLGVLKNLKKRAESLHLAFEEREKLEIIGQKHDLLARTKGDVFELLSRGDLQGAIYKTRALFEKIVEAMCRGKNEDWCASTKNKVNHIRKLDNKAFTKLYFQVMFEKINQKELENIINELVEIKDTLL